MNNKYRGRGKVSLSVQSTSFIWEWAATGEHLAPFSLNLCRHSCPICWGTFSDRGCRALGAGNLTRVGN